jgi:hypothetical protein
MNGVLPSGLPNSNCDGLFRNRHRINQLARGAICKTPARQRSIHFSLSSAATPSPPRPTNSFRFEIVNHPPARYRFSLHFHLRHKTDAHGSLVPIQTRAARCSSRAAPILTSMLMVRTGETGIANRCLGQQVAVGLGPHILLSSSFRVWLRCKSR